VSTPFLLLYGDDVYGPDGLKRLLRHEWALLARKVERPERFGVLVTRPDGTVAHMVEKPKEFVSNLSWVGAAMLQPEFFAVGTPLSPRGEYEATDMVNALIERGVRFATEMTDLWLPANTLEEVAEAERVLGNEQSTNA
jgi:dTDP-glucose pyrophosphorylase